MAEWRKEQWVKAFFAYIIHIQMILATYNHLENWVYNDQFPPWYSYPIFILIAYVTPPLFSKLK